MLVEYYQAKMKGRNAGAVVVVVGPWPQRVLAHRGLTAERLIWRRQATPVEEEEVRDSTRLRCFTYPTAQALLKDEVEILSGRADDLSTLRQLIQAAEIVRPTECHYA